MSCEQVYIGNYEAYKTKIEEMKSLDKSIVLLFCGSTEESTGDSWCADCRDAEPFIENGIKSSHDLIFVLVEVGFKEEWKSKSNNFRCDSDLKLNEIPTIIDLKKNIRLVGRQCCDAELVNDFFTKA